MISMHPYSVLEVIVWLVRLADSTIIWSLHDYSCFLFLVLYCRLQLHLVSKLLFRYVLPQKSRYNCRLKDVLDVKGRYLCWHIVTKEHKLQLVDQARPGNQAAVYVLIKRNLALGTSCCHNVLLLVLANEDKELLSEQGVAINVAENLHQDNYIKLSLALNIQQIEDHFIAVVSVTIINQELEDFSEPEKVDPD
jgi:hypothetical protein